MSVVSFGPWAPDQPRYGNTCLIARNVYPTTRGYGPFAGPAVFSEPLPAKCVGRISFRTVLGVRETFAGTATRLYRLNGTTWDDVSPSAYTSATQWRFALYGGRLIATNGVDNPQKFVLGSDSYFSTLTNAPKHRFPFVVRDVLVASDLTDGSGYQLAWSVVNDSEDWTVLNGGGVQAIPDGGPVVGGTGGEFGLVLQESALIRMDFVGGDLRFTFDQIEGSVGCVYPDSIVPYKGRTFYLSEEGFQVFDGAESRNISDEAVSDYFFANFAPETRVTSTADTRVTDAGADERVTAGSGFVEGALDPRNSSVVWNYLGTAGTAKQLIYNYTLNQWSEATASISQLYTGFRRVGNQLAGFDSSNQLNYFDGTDLTAVLSTGDIQIAADRGAVIQSVRGLVDSAHDITVAKKTDLADTEVTKTGSSNSNGKCSIRSNGRLQRIQLTPTATFTEISGVDVEAVAGGRKV